MNTINKKNIITFAHYKQYNNSQKKKKLRMNEKIFYFQRKEENELTKKIAYTYFLVS